MKLSLQEVRGRVEAIQPLLDPCGLCPRQCGAKRLSGQIGVCGAGALAKVASWAAHRGEEPPISGTRGSGTLFASHCPMKCCYCQNFPFSQLGNGMECDTEKLTGLFRKLVKMRVHNFNLVTAVHFMPQILTALLPLWEDGTALPIVYNNSGYESLELLRLLEGIVDVYLPDIRYSDNAIARTYSGVSDYVERDREAIVEMFRQTGLLQTDAEGIATRGTIVRHLVLPGGLSHTRESLTWLKSALGVNIHLSLMCQYFPAHRAFEREEINRKITDEEYLAALDIVEELGFENVWAQDPYEHGGA